MTFESGSIRGEGYVKNVSKTGLFLRASPLPSVGTQVRVFFTDRKGARVELSGTVRWTTEQLPPSERAEPGFGIHVALGNEAFTEFFEQILFS